MTTLTTLKISELRRDADLQSRVGMNEAVIEDYAEGYRDGVSMPPPRCFFDGSTHWLADGFHRVEGSLRAGREIIVCDVGAGTRRDAVLYAAGANKSHGLRRTNGDKRNAVSILVYDNEWANWSNRRIARHTGVSDVFVGNLRRELGAAEPSARTGADGRTINTSNIGREHATANGSQSKLTTSPAVSSAPGSSAKRTVPRKHQEASAGIVDMGEELDEIHRALEALFARLPGSDPPAAEAALARLMRSLEAAFQETFGPGDDER